MLFYTWVESISSLDVGWHFLLRSRFRLRAPRFMLIAMCWLAFLLIWWSFLAPNRWVLRDYPLGAEIDDDRCRTHAMMETFQAIDWMATLRRKVWKFWSTTPTPPSWKSPMKWWVHTPLTIVSHESNRVRVGCFRSKTCTSPPGNFAWSASSPNAPLILSTTCRMTHASRPARFPASIATRTSCRRSISSSPIMQVALSFDFLVLF